MGLPAVYFDADIFAALETREDAEDVLYWLLEALAHANTTFLKAYPETTKFFDATNIKYIQDPSGREWWKGINKILQTGYADCKSLAAWRVAECRYFYGEDGRGDKGLAIFEIKRHKITANKITYHITLIRGDGTREDPSSILGMGVVR